MVLTSNICVGSRSVSIRCPNPSPSPPPLTFPHEKVPLSKNLTLMVAVMAQCVLLQVVAAWKTLSTKSTLVFSLPGVNSEVSMQFIRPAGYPGFKTSKVVGSVSPGKPPDTAWPTAKVGLVPYVPSQVSSQVWSLLVNLSAVGIVAQMHCWLSSRPRYLVDKKVLLTCI